MINFIIYTFLLSISPLGEARVGIPYGILNGLNPVLAFFVGLLGNLLIFPIFMYLIDAFNAKLWRYPFYKKQNIWLIRRAKKGLGDKIQKYGFWGLMIFVMIPLPTTGAYIGTIAAYIFKLQRREAFMAVSLGVIISCLIMAASTHLSLLGISLF